MRCFLISDEQFERVARVIAKLRGESELDPSKQILVILDDLIQEGPSGSRSVLCCESVQQLSHEESTPLIDIRTVTTGGRLTPPTYTLAVWICSGRDWCRKVLGAGVRDA